MSIHIKNIKSGYFFSLFVLAAIMQLMSCGGDPAPSEQEVVTEKLMANNWTMQSVTVDNVDQSSVYRGLAIKFAASTFTTTNGGVVWPASGAWAFNDADATAIKRDDGIVVTVEATDATLKLTLMWATTTLSGGRANSVKGQNVFSFVK